VIFFDTSHAAECVGSSTARSTPPSSSATVNVTLGAENTGCRYTRAISAVLMYSAM